jgi:chorismate mutase
MATIARKGINLMNIEYWRTEIDEIDRELLQLLNRRARLAMKVGALKKTAGLPCCDPEREQVVLTTLQKANTGPLDQSAVAKLFRRIIVESRRVEARITDREEIAKNLKYVGASGKPPEVSL